MKKLLVPTDFSKQAENALKIAGQIAEKNDAEIFLLHSIELPSQFTGAPSTGGIPDSLFFIRSAEQRFKSFKEAEDLKNIRVSTIIGRGEIFNDIQRTCEENNIDLIVMGSTGASGFKEMFVGSNTEKVVRTSDTPVLVIKGTPSDFIIKDFVFATDFSERFKPALRRALAFAEKFDANLHLLWVNTPVDFKTSAHAKDQMQKYIEGMNLKDVSLNIYNDFTVEKGIINFSKSIGAQLIGMATHGRKGISHILNGSISEDMVNRADIPIITFKI